jgi:FtsP/CotA-like multicopper oxidase with cupredoxin domain
MNTRRSFLKASALTGAGLTLPFTILAGRMGGGGGGGMGGTDTSVINPPIGALLKDPPTMPNLSTTPGVVEVNLETRIASVNVNGVQANLMTYNGSFPGPTIRVRKGDRLKVNLTNRLPYTTATNMLGYQRNITNLHTHGWHVSPEDPSDFVMYELLSGETKNHVYDTSRQEAGTLNFYHPHVHGSTAEQYWAGLVGGLIVEDETPVLAAYETHLLILKDIALSGTNPAPHSMMSDYMHGKEGNTVMVNGQVNPRLYMRQGQVQRWRILNASNARFYRLSFESHMINVIGTDGGLLDRPYPVSEIILSPGERVELLVKCAFKTGNFRLLSLPYSRMGMSSGQTVTLLTVTANGSLTPAQELPATINPEAVRLNPYALPIAAQRSLTLSMGQGNGYINGQDFDVNPYMVMSDLDTFELWTIHNNSGMDHPFHQHVNSGQIISVIGGDPGYAALYSTMPAWKDVVLVPKWGSVTILLPVMDYKGMAMFHCHILEHEDIGMMGMWHLMGMGM